MRGWVTRLVNLQVFWAGNSIFSVFGVFFFFSFFFAGGEEKKHFLGLVDFLKQWCCRSGFRIIL